MNLTSMWAAFAASAVTALAVGDIESNDPQVGAEFGSMITFNNFTYAIGAPGHSGGGRVELRSVVQGEHNVLVNPTLWSHEDDRFGAAVSLTDSLCVIGAPGFDEPATNTGGAWVFERSIAGWNYYQSLQRSDESSNDEFGTALAIGGNRIFVGAPRAEWNGSARGMVAVYAKEQDGHAWTIERELFPGNYENNGMGYGKFGAALASDGRFLAVGAPGMNPGACFVYRISGPDSLPSPMMSTWRPDVVSAPEGGGFNSMFGASIAIEGDLMVVGAPGWWANGLQGAVFFYRLQGGEWNVEVSFSSTEYSALGASVAIKDGVVAVGDPDAEGGGRIHVFLEMNGQWFEQTPELSQPTVGDETGRSVALHAGQIYAGDPQHGGGIVRVATVLTCLDCNENGTCDEEEIASDPFLDCDSNGIIDECEGFVDCNSNGVNDLCEIAQDPDLDCDDNGALDSCQQDLDCDGNGVIDVCESEDEPARCLPETGPTPIEILVLEDTSGSTDSERKIVCGMIGDAIAELNGNVGIQVTGWWTRIAAFPGGAGCFMGEEFPIPHNSSTVSCEPWGPRFVENTEDWGDAISHAVLSFPWREDGVRIIIVLSDEGPSGGDLGGDCGVDDLLSLELAAHLASHEGVHVFPTPLPGTDSCLFGTSNSLMSLLAAGSFASVLDARNLETIDSAEILGQLVVAIDESPYVLDCSSCQGDVDGNGMVDANDLLQVISDWGMTESPADLNEDGLVDASDLLEVIAGWGLCG